MKSFKAYKEGQLKQTHGYGFQLVDNGYFTMTLKSRRAEDCHRHLHGPDRLAVHPGHGDLDARR